MYPFAEINLLAPLGAALAAMILGFVWYSPKVFGEIWMKAAGVPNKKPSGSEMAVSLILGLVASFITAFMLGQVFVLQGNIEVEAALTTSALVWLGFQMPIALGRVTWEGKSWGLFLINSGYLLISVLVAGYIMYSWA